MSHRPYILEPEARYSPIRDSNYDMYAAATASKPRDTRIEELARGSNDDESNVQGR